MCRTGACFFAHTLYGGYLRFRHFGQDKIEMDFALLAIALNLSKLVRKLALSAKTTEKQHQKRQFIACFQSYIIETKGRIENLETDANIPA